MQCDALAADHHTAITASQQGHELDLITELVCINTHTHTRPVVESSDCRVCNPIGCAISHRLGCVCFEAKLEKATRHRVNIGTAAKAVTGCSSGPVPVITVI